MRRSVVALLVAAGCLFDTAPAEAQRPKPAPKEPPPPKETPAAPPAPDKIEAASATSADALAVVQGGLTADQAAQRAAGSSLSVRASEKDLESLNAKLDLATLTYIPRLDLLAQYERFSVFTPPEISPGVRLPVFFNYYLTQATLTVPLSDYFLKIPHTRAAAARAEEAGENDLAAAKAKAFFDGKVAYYNWLRAKGNVAVAGQSQIVARAHMKDTEALFNVGKVSKADVLRAQTEVGTSDLLVERTKATLVLAERQLRVLMHASESETLQPGESLDGALPDAATNVKALLDEAQANRPELRSFELNADSAREVARAARAGRIPTLSAFADFIYANPNQRRIPASDTFFPSWDAGVRLTWSPNDFLSGGANAADAEAKAASAEAKKAQQRDAVDVEVIGAIEDVLQSDVSIKVTEQQLESATEGHRVARELFIAGRSTGTALIDSENALAQSRFNHMNARVDARIARTRLEYVVGRIARAASK